MLMYNEMNDTSERKIKREELEIFCYFKALALSLK